MRKSFSNKIVFFLFMGAFLWMPYRLCGQKSAAEIRYAQKFKEHLNAEKIFRHWEYLGNMQIDSVSVNNDSKQISLFLSPNVSHIPIRELWIRSLNHKIQNALPRRFRSYNIDLYCKGRKLHTFIPPLFSQNTDSSRLASPGVRIPLVQKHENKLFGNGLYGKNIALWASHGYYYENDLDRWEWQRARLFGTVEDIFPYAVVNQFLVLMLEDAGANVFLPRERDLQTHEVIVDNDSSTGESELIVENMANNWTAGSETGFMKKDTLFNFENPFSLGSYLKINTSTDSTARLVYVPDIPETGDYAVYISWAKEAGALDRVPCFINHSGGQTRLHLNQQMAFHTWVYLGTFHFQAGKHPERGSLIIETPRLASGVVSADAVRFGGGMGNVAREKVQPDARQKNEISSVDTNKNQNHNNYKLSGLPRWMEAARYYLQYAGMPDSLVYNFHSGSNDYADDYKSRGEWVNYLMGNPNGPTNHRKVEGLNIPVDLAFAFHTDAGVTPDDSIIGTLGIYSSERDDGLFPNGKSKLASRDLTDIVQTQIVTDIRLLFNEKWTRRAMWDREYSEAWRPQTPTMLLELLSHQNLADMKYGLDPRFQFTVARAVYKGMARFLAARERQKATIKPLAPDHIAIEHLDGKRIKISWRPVKDPLETTAMATGYRLYQKVEDNGFDNGIFTSDTSMIVELPEYRTLYSFRVKALNEGGQSFASETASVSLQPGIGKIILVVNGFDRIAPPSFVDGMVAGISWWDDQGVPWHHQLYFTGQQHDYNRQSPWLDDDSPGHGASYANMEGKIIPGNSFNFPIIHGLAIREAGFSFVSVSDEAFENPTFETDPYFAIDFIFGEEKSTPALLPDHGNDFVVWTPALRNKIGKYLDKGGNIFISGAYVASDPVENKDSLAIDFAKEKLHFSWMTNHADNAGITEVTTEASTRFLSSVTFNVGYHPDIYTVEAPDALEPTGNNAFRIFRYASGNSTAAIGYEGKYKTVVMGFPFETITDELKRNKLMKQILSFFEEQEN